MDKTQEEHDRQIKYMIENFQAECCPYGYMDIQAAMEIFKDFNKTSCDLIEAIDEYIYSCEGDRNALDITALAYDTILQEIRNKIDTLIGFDLMNDANFYAYGNYMCSSFDYSTDDIELLTKAIKEASPEARTELLNDNDVLTWLDQYIDGIDINQFEVMKE